MNYLIFDTDILSTFGKIKRLDVLRKLLPDMKYFIPPSVYSELFRAKNFGYDFVDHILENEFVEVISLTKEELIFSGKLSEERKALGSGELESISICKHRNCIFITNDAAAKKICDIYNIKYIDLCMILKSLLITKIFSHEELTKLIMEIEEKDKVVIKDVEEILRE